MLFKHVGVLNVSIIFFIKRFFENFAKKKGWKNIVTNFTYNLQIKLLFIAVYKYFHFFFTRGSFKIWLIGFKMF